MRFDPIYLYNLPRQPAYEAQLAIRAGQIALNMMKAGNRIGQNNQSKRRRDSRQDFGGKAMKVSGEGKPHISPVVWHTRSGEPYRMWKCDRPGTLPGFGYIPEAAYEVWALRNKRDAG